MKLIIENYNANSDDEENEDSGEDDVTDEESPEEGDELEDDEDEPPAEVSPADKAANQSLGGGNSKIVLKKIDGAGTKKSKTKIGSLVDAAIKHLNERSGSSIVAIKRVIVSNNNNMDTKRLGLHIKRYIKHCLEDGTMVQIKRSFKFTKKHGDQSKKLEKEREKARKQRLEEKKKEKKQLAKTKSKENGKDSKSQSKETTGKAKSTKRPATKKNKDNTTKKPKLDNATASKKAAAKTEGAKASKELTEKSKSKMKARKSINLLVRPTPPRPKTMKKVKAGGAAAAKKKINLPESGAAGNPKTAAVTSGSGRSKRK